jgi:hypothetical protein
MQQSVPFAALFVGRARPGRCRFSDEGSPFGRFVVGLHPLPLINNSGTALASLRVIPAIGGEAAGCT